MTASFRILYITRAKLVLSRAHNHNILKTAEALSDLGYHVTLLSITPQDASDIRKIKDVSESVVLDVYPHRRMTAFILFGRRSDFDVLYFRDPYLFYAAWVARFLLGKKVVFEVHGSHEWRWGKPFWCLALLASTGAVFITERLFRYYHYQKPYVVVPTSGVDIKAFAVDENRVRELRRNLKLRDNMPVLVYAGSFLWHDVGILVDMLAELSRPAQLLIVGAKPEERQELVRRAEKHAVGNRVFIVKRVPPTLIPQYLMLADILLNPLVITYPGSVSSKLYEYLAVGKPIVSTRGGANDEIIEHERNGILTASCSVNDFTDVVDHLLGDVELQKQLGSSAKSYATRYTWEARGGSISALLEKLTRT